jgi:hypothetical protein
MSKRLGECKTIEEVGAWCEENRAALTRANGATRNVATRQITDACKRAGADRLVMLAAAGLVEP